MRRSTTSSPNSSLSRQKTRSFARPISLSGIRDQTFVNIANAQLANTKIVADQTYDEQALCGIIQQRTRPAEERLKNLIGQTCLQKCTKQQKDEFIETLKKDAGNFRKEDVEKGLLDTDYLNIDKNFANSTYDFIHDVTVFLPIQDQLYKIVGSLSNNSSNQWCPIMLKVGNGVKQKLSDNRINPYEYLLQVWSREGKCVFERQFTQSMLLVNWFINRDVFVWEERNIGVFQSHFYCLKLFENKKPILAKINVAAQADQSEEAIDKKSWQKYDSYRFMRICYNDGHIFFARNQKIYYFEIESRMQEPSMFANDFSRQQTRQQQSGFDQIDEGALEISLELSDLRSFQPTQGHSIKCFLDIGKDELKGDQRVVLLLEREKRESNHERELRCGKSLLNQRDQQNQIVYDLLFIEFKLKQGEQVFLETRGYSSFSYAKMEEIMLVVEKDKRQNDKEFCVAISLHRDATVQFYYNLHEVHRSNYGHGRVTNITISDNAFYLKIFENDKKQPIQESYTKSSFGHYENNRQFYSTYAAVRANKVLGAQEGDQPNYDQIRLRGCWEEEFIPDEKQPQNIPIIQKCPFQVKNKICMSSCVYTAKEKKDTPRVWQNAQSSRAQHYFKIFRDILPLKQYVLIAHRNFVSTYNFARHCWTNTFMFDDWVKEICINEIPEGYIENENYDDSQPTENFISINDLVAPDDLKLWNMPNLEEHKVIFMAEEDIYGVNVFVGNNLEDVKTLRYCKVNENICEIDKVAEKYKSDNQAFLSQNKYVIQLRNDDDNNKGTFMMVQNVPPQKIMEQQAGSLNSFYNFQVPSQAADVVTKLICFYKGYIDEIANHDKITYLAQFRDSLKEFQLDAKCQLSVYIGADAEKNEENLDRQIETRDQVTQVMISSQSSSIVISIVEEKTPKEDPKHIIRKYQVEDVVYEHPKVTYLDQEQEVLVGCVVAHDESYKDCRYSLVRFTNKSISVYDKDGDLRMSYLKLKIIKLLQVDDKNMYCICDKMDEPIMKSKVKTIDENNQTEVDETVHKPGLWMFDLQQLICNESFEAYRLGDSLLGCGRLLILASQIDKICVQPDQSTLALIPFFHRNTYNFEGMSVRQEYLIWRETPTLFCALHRSGMLQTWNKCSGKLIHYEYTDQYTQYNDYALYQADEFDQSQMMNFGQQERRSISLIKKVLPEIHLAQCDVPKPTKENKVTEQDKDCCDSFLNVLCPFNKKKTEYLATEEADKSNQYYDNYVANNLNDRMHCESMFKPEASVVFQAQEVSTDNIYFNFKVLMLRSFQDQPENAVLKQKRLEELFNFDFPLCRLQNQRLYLSDDCSKLLVIEKQTSATIYRLKKQYQIKLDTQDKYFQLQMGKVEWEPITQIKQFPSILQGQCSANFLFSKNFEYMLDIQYGKNQLVIKRLRKNIVKEKEDSLGNKFIQVEGSEYQKCFRISSDIFKLDFSHSLNWDDVVQLVTKRIRWIGKETLEMVNEKGISCYIKFNDPIYQMEQYLRKLIDNRDLEQTKAIYSKCLVDANFQGAKSFFDKSIPNEIWHKIEKNVDQLIELQYNPDALIQDIIPIYNDFKLVSYCKIDNFQLEAIKNYHHYILEAIPIKKKNVFQRLMRHAQLKKLHQQHHKNQLKWREADDLFINQEVDRFDRNDPLLTDEKYKQRDRIITVLKKLFIVDYDRENCEEKSSSFSVQISFTVLDWLIVEKIMSEPSFKLDDYDQMQKIQLCFNVFPRGLSILHKLASNQKEEDLQSDQLPTQTQLNEIVQGLFKAASMGFEFSMFEFSENEPLEIPFIENSCGNTVIDMALCIDESAKQGALGKKQHKDFKDQDMRQNIDLQLAGIVFANIKNYSIWHDGPMLTQAVIKAIEFEVPGIHQYIESRFLKNQRIISPIQNMLKNTQFLAEGFEYATCQVQVFVQKKETGDELFVPDRKGTQNKQTLYDDYILDIPGLDGNTQTGKSFINALDALPVEESPNQIFGIRVVQIIIERHWDQIKMQYCLSIVVPYFLWLAIFYIWTTFTLDQLADLEKKTMQSTVFLWLTLLMSCYQLLLQVLGLIGNPSSYLRKPLYKFIEWIAPLLIIINCVRLILTKIQVKEQKLTIGQAEYILDEKVMDNSFWIVQAVSELLIWYKIITILSIFKSTAYLMQMVQAVSYQILPFIGFLIVAILALASTFLSISKLYEGDRDILEIRDKIIEDPGIKRQQDYLDLDPQWNKKFTSTGKLGTLDLKNIGQAASYTFQMAIGNIADPENLDGYGWVAFIFACIFLPIILMNLLIAIVGSVYEQKSENKYMNYYLARTNMIQEFYMITNHSVFQSQSHDADDSDRFMFVVSDKISQDMISSEQDQMTDLLDQTKQIHQIVDDIKYFLDQTNQENDKHRHFEQRQKLLERRNRGHQQPINTMAEIQTKNMFWANELEKQRLQNESKNEAGSSFQVDITNDLLNQSSLEVVPETQILVQKKTVHFEANKQDDRLFLPKPKSTGSGKFWKSELDKQQMKQD